MKTPIQFGKLLKNATSTVTRAAVFTGLVLSLNNCIEAPSASLTDATNPDAPVSAQNTVSAFTGRISSGDASALAGASIALTQKAHTDTMELGRAGKKGVLGLGRFGGRGVRGLVNERGQFKPLNTMTDDEGETCEDISTGLEGVIATDCTDAEGTYAFAELACDTEYSLFAKKGSFTLSINITVDCEDADTDADEDEDDDDSDYIVEMDDIEFSDDCGLSDATDEDDDLVYATSESCDFDIARMAVITGEYDQIENVLAKLGYGEIDENGRFDINQDHDFTIIDGTGELDDAEFMNVDEFLADADMLAEYDIIFVNCGVDEEALAGREDVVTNLQEYVYEGGKLYVTDWSYAFLENAFPSFIDFYEGGDDHEHAEEFGAALEGKGGITTDADIKDPLLANWLDHVTVNNGSLKDTCEISDEDVDAITGARNIDGTITIGDFLNNWTVVQGTHAGYDDEVTVHLKGIISAEDGVADLPLSLTQNVGSGKLLFSSYHTAHGCPTAGFWPQERVLQYLVFDM